MPSAKGVQGPHDRDPSKPRSTCIQVSRHSGQRCKRYTTVGSRLCRSHLLMARGESTQGNSVKGGQAVKAKNEANDMIHDAETNDGVRLTRKRSQNLQNATGLVVSEQARAALAKLGTPLSAQDKVDPRVALLDTVRSAVRQREVWESMYASIPEPDWSALGMPPIPGSTASAKGARIEVISKNLAEATKNASRIAKMAIDAGIEERLVRLAEEQSALIADTVKAAVIAAVGSLGLSALDESTTLDNALHAAATHLRLLAAAPIEASIDGGNGYSSPHNANNGIGSEIFEGIASNVVDLLPTGDSGADPEHYLVDKR